MKKDEKIRVNAAIARALESRTPLAMWSEFKYETGTISDKNFRKLIRDSDVFVKWGRLPTVSQMAAFIRGFREEVDE